MEKLYLDLSIVLFFLAALAVVSRNKEKLSLKSKISIELISVGLCCLSLMSLLTLIQNQMVMLFSIPTAAIAVVELFRLVLLFGGLVLVTSGISKWLPFLGARPKKDETSIMRIAQLQRLGKLVSSSSTWDEFLRESLEVVADNVPVTTGVVYAVSAAKDSAKLMASLGVFGNTGDVSEKFVVSPGWLQSLSPAKLTTAGVSFSKIHPNAIGFCYCFPMTVAQGRTFLYLLWTKDKNKAETFDPYVMQSLTSALNSRLMTARLSLSDSFNSMCAGKVQSLKNKITSQQSTNEMLLTAMTDLQNYLPVEYTSICLMNADGNGRRVSIGQSGTVLNESDVYLGPSDGYLFQVLESRREVYFKNIAGEKEVSFPELLAVSRIKSLFALPLAGACGSKGVLTVGTGQAGAYRNVDLALLKRTTSCFEYILNELVHEKQFDEVREREQLLKDFAKEMADTSSADSLYNQTVSVISRAVGCAMVRLSTVDQEGKFLNSEALINEGVDGVRPPEHGQLELSLLPWHNSAQMNGQTVSIECGSGQHSMSEIESMQVFAPGVKRAVIVPIKHGNKILGLISLADNKEFADSSITAQNIGFVEVLAVITAAAMAIRVSRVASRADFAALSKEDDVDGGQRREMRSRLKSSLASILGSLDLIKSGAPHNEIKKDRFLEIIDKSARKMHEYLSD